MRSRSLQQTPNRARKIWTKQEEKSRTDHNRCNNVAKWLFFNIRILLNTLYKFISDYDNVEDICACVCCVCVYIHVYKINI